MNFTPRLTWGLALLRIFLVLTIFAVLFLIAAYDIL